MPPYIYPTGVTIYKPDKAYNCFVLFDGRDARAHLIDMNGNNARIWNHLGFPAEMINPAINKGKRGHVFVHQKGEELFANKTLLELDWDGNVVWEWGDKAPGGNANQNHDLARLPNGNTLIVSYIEVKSDDESRARRRQCIYEVAPEGQIVWTWIPAEHADEFGYSEEVLALIRARGSQLGMNDMDPLGPNKWYRAGDERFHPDNVLVGESHIAIIDKKTSKVVWVMPRDYPGMDESLKWVFNPSNHDAHMIPDGLPGGGNILVFDNHGSALFPPAYGSMWQANPSSRILEIDPIKKQLVWEYTAEHSLLPLWEFHSSFISSARRLPNGNTLINEGMRGRMFQVTSEGEIVWEYVSPYYGKMGFGEWKRAARANWVFRAQPIPYDWVPEGTSHSENPVTPPNVSEFHIR